MSAGVRMGETDRVLGKLEEFQIWSKEQFKDLKEDIDQVRQEVDELKKFRWIVSGKATVVYSFVVGSLEYLIHMLAGSIK